MKNLSQKLPKFISGIFVTSSVLLLYFIQLQVFTHIEFKLYDSLIAQLEQSEPTGIVTIIDIDEQSLSEHGQWPWPRYKVASLLDKLQQMQPLAIAMDFVFAEPDRTSLNRIQADLLVNHKLPLDLAHIPAPLLDNDQQMSIVLNHGPFVLGYAFNFDKQPAPLKIAPDLQPLTMLFHYQEDNLEENPLAWYQPTTVVNNIAAFSQVAKTAGFFNARPENDGILRKVPLIMQYQNKLYPNLSLATLMTALQTQQTILKVSSAGMESLILDQQQIPLDKQANFWIHFRATDKSVFNTISAANILNNSIAKESIANKIILLGSSAKGLYDIKSTPYNAIFPGVEVHATIIDNIIRGDFIKHPNWAVIAELLLIVLAGLLSFVIISKSKALISLVLNFALVLLLIYSSWRWLQQGEYISIWYPVLAVLLNFIIVSVWQYWNKEEKLLQQTIALNKIQENALNMLKQSNLKLEKESLSLENSQLELQQNSFELEQQIEKNTEQLSKAFSALDRSNQEINDSLLYGARIQRSLLPKNRVFNDLFKDSFIIWEPRDKVGGDIYFCSRTDSGFVIAVIDCTGHGVPGALLSMIAIATLKKIIKTDVAEHPAKMLKQLNYSVKTTLGQEQENAVADDGLEISLCYIDIENKILRYAGAGLPLLYIQNKQLLQIRADKQKIGYRQSRRSDINYEFSQHQIPIDLPTRCYLYSDGLVDQVGGENFFPLGNKRFKEFLNNNYHIDFKKQKQQLERMLMDYQGTQNRRDDITVIGFYL
ncbi:MAG: CHASE2 domain-containing protein [Pseudomonadota bacterium]